MQAADILWCVKIAISFLMIHNPNEVTLTDSAITYLSTSFLLDAVTTFPSVYYWGDAEPYTITSSFRLLYFSQLMNPFSMCLNQLCLRSYTQHRFNQIFFFISLFFFMLVLAHMCACFWIYIGRLDEDLPEDQRQSWLFVQDDFKDKGDYWLWTFSFYWIWEVFSTVGYGDYVGGTREEFVFSIALELIGLTFFSLLMGLTGEFVSDLNQGF